MKSSRPTQVAMLAAALLSCGSPATPASSPAGATSGTGVRLGTDAALSDVSLGTPVAGVPGMKPFPQLALVDAREIEWYELTAPGSIEGLPLNETHYGFARGELVEIDYELAVDRCPELLVKLRTRLGAPSKVAEQPPTALYDWTGAGAALHLAQLPKRCGGYLRGAKAPPKK